MRLGVNLPYDEAVKFDDGLLVTTINTLAAAGIRGCLTNFVNDEKQWEAISKKLIKRLDEGGMALLEYNAPFFIPTTSRDTVKKEAEKFVRLLAISENIGCLSVGTCAMGPNSIYPHPANRTPGAYDILKQTCELIARDAQRLGLRARLEIEVVYTTLLGTPREVADFVDEIASPNIQGHMDIVNCLTLDNVFDHADYIKEAFRVMKGRFYSAHIKDVRPVRSYLPGIEIAPLGEGCLDLKTYLQCLAELPATFPAVIEHIDTVQESIEAYRRVKNLCMELGMETWGDG